MSSAIQNRLVGTIILVALVVIFLPDILDGKKQRYQETFVDIPPRPPIKQVKHVESFPLQEVANKVQRQIEIVDQQPVDEQSPSESEPVTVERQSKDNSQPPTEITAVPEETEGQDYPVEDVAPTTVPKPTAPAVELKNAGWVVQLGVFRHQKNVRELLGKLKNAGYRAFSRPVMTRSGELTKVFVGPDLQKEKLEQALGHLQEVTNLKGRIAPFTVN